MLLSFFRLLHAIKGKVQIGHLQGYYRQVTRVTGFDPHFPGILEQNALTPTFSLTTFILNSLQISFWLKVCAQPLKP
jgi:hypothetical protein